MEQYQNISIDEKYLSKLKITLGRGGSVKIAKTVNCTPDWVRKVLQSPELAAVHTHIIKAALQLASERKQDIATISNNIDCL